MKLEEIASLLKTTGYPVAYCYFAKGKPPDMPFVVYQEVYSNNFSADGAVYLPVRHIQINLYTNSKQPEAEDKVESALSSLFWNKQENYNVDEKIYRITYEIEV